MLRAYSRKPSALSMAAAVYESSPPLNKTTAVRDVASGLIVRWRHSRRNPQPSTRNPQPLNSPGVWAPDVLVHLKLDAHGNAIGEHPLAEGLRIEQAVDRREVHGRDPGRQRVS